MRKFTPWLLALVFGAALLGAQDYQRGGVFDPARDVEFLGTYLVIPRADSPAQTVDGAIVWDSDSDLLTIGTGSARKTAVDTNSTQTLTNKTLTSPTLSSPSLTTPSMTSPTITGSAGTGFAIVKKCTLTETGVAGPYTCTIPVPAGAVIEDIQVIPRVLWNGTSATLNVGDTADPDGYFAAFDLKATDLLVGEMLSAKHGDLWGGKNGAYLVAATGRRGPTTSNFAMSYVAGSNILFAVTAGAADGSAGRTDCVVIYSTGETITQTTS